MSEKDPNDDGMSGFPKIPLENSFRKIRTCEKCKFMIIVLEQLDFYQGALWVVGICPWCKEFVYKRKKEDGDELLALSN